MNPQFTKYGFIPKPPVLSASQFRESVKTGDIDMWLPEEVLGNVSYKNKIFQILNVSTSTDEEDTEKKNTNIGIPIFFG